MVLLTIFGYSYSQTTPLKGKVTDQQNKPMQGVSIVVKGTALEDRSAQRKRLSRKNVTKTIPGTRVGVRTIFIFHFSPLNDLYARAEA